MKPTRLIAPHRFEAGFAAIRAELDVPLAFPADVLAAADAAEDRYADRRSDRRDLPLVAIDPVGAMDLDQAFHAERRGQGFRVSYAIADVGAFVQRGDPIDAEARRRGTTLYSPDLRTPLHPPALSEDKASLLAGTVKPCVLWTIDLDSVGAPAHVTLERATVEVDEAISYTDAQRRIDRGDAGSLMLLREIGTLREQREIGRGGISLNLPAQEVVERDDTYTLEFDLPLPVEGWNAQISLLTGIVAGRRMVADGVGVLRTLPPTRAQDLRRLRRTARTLGVDWPDDTDYAEMIRTVEPDTPQKAAFLLQAARSFRGAGYVAFRDGVVPELSEHGAIASNYAHVTAPLRRLVDRFGNEVLLSLFAGEEPSAELIEDLDELPSLMGRARSRESALDRAMIDFAEVVVVSNRIGERFPAAVVAIDDRSSRAFIQITEPAIESHVPAAGRSLGETLVVELVSADVSTRSLTWEIVD